MNHSDVIDLLRAALGAVLPKDAFDVEPNPEDGAIEAATDDWTLRLENWPTGIAWLALDEEPDEGADPAALRAALGKAVPPPVTHALAGVDRQTDGALVAALVSSNDPLSAELAALLKGDEGAPANNAAIG